jgi:P4 family phage/plasmid primase-like protien
MNEPKVIIRDFFSTVLGSRPGYVALAFGGNPYRKETGSYRHGRWAEKHYRWPDDFAQLVADAVTAMPTSDVYVCPALRSQPKRRKGTALPPQTCWVDLDKEPLDAELVENLGALIVASGQPGHIHAYVPLTEPVSLELHAALNQRLAQRLGGDAKWSDESLLRLPSTLNHKPTLPLNGHAPQPPAPVTVIGWPSKVWNPADLLALLGDAAVQNTPEIAPLEEVDFSLLPSSIVYRLETLDPPDRSVAFHGLVAACRAEGLTQGQTLTVMDSWSPARDKYGTRLAAEVARSWAKVAPDTAGWAEVGAPTPTYSEGRVVEANPAKYINPKDGGLQAVTLARDVIAIGPLLTGEDERMWRYTGGVWRADKNVVRYRTAWLTGNRYRSNHVTSVEDVIRSRVGTIAAAPVSQYINFRNGLLDWQTGELCEHSSSVLSTVQLPLEYQPDATCLHFDKFLSEVLPAADVIDLVWELIGYFMYSGNPFHKAVMLIGKGRNGKGTFLRVLQALLGRFNIANVSLHDLVNTRFSTASLVGKLANIAGDIDASYLENTALFKAITGGDSISAEHKGRDRFDFTPWAVPVFSANKVPASADTTAGYLSRWLVIPFPYSFEGREDRTLDAKLRTTAELQGIAAHAVSVLPTLLARHNFTTPDSVREATIEFNSKVDHVRRWAADCCELSAKHKLLVLRSTLYQAYTTWAEREGMHPVKASEFSDRLEALGAVLKIRDGYRGFIGIQITDPSSRN